MGVYEERNFYNRREEKRREEKREGGDSDCTWSREVGKRWWQDMYFNLPHRRRIRAAWGRFALPPNSAFRHQSFEVSIIVRNIIRSVAVGDKRGQVNSGVRREAVLR